MKIDIKDQDSGEIITTQEVDDSERNPLRAAAIQAVKAGISLEYADLSDADLRRADLRGEDLRGANLRRAGLRYAVLRCADLRCADLRCADLRGADLRGEDLRGADFSGANLRGANLTRANLRDANLSDANLRDANFSGANLQDVDWGDVDIPVVKNIHKRVYEAATTGALNMGETTHCRAGWAIVLAGKQGRKLRKKYGTSVTACMIYSKSDPEMTWMPDFDCSDAEALRDMKRMARGGR